MAIASKGSDQRTIVVLMVFTTGIALIGHTISSDVKAVEKPGVKTIGTAALITLAPPVGDAQILLGGTIATVILTLLSEGGESLAKFSKGIAFIALLAVLANYGGPVANGLNRVTGAIPGSTPTTTTATKPKASAPAKKGAA